MSNVEDERIDKEVAKLGSEPELPKVAAQWAQLNEYVVKQAYMVPFGHRKLTTFLSERMNFEDCTVVSPIYYNDYSQFCLEEEG